ncbi:hypothetical protein Tco_0547861, partial [Tanacetum coccineum]
MNDSMIELRETFQAWLQQRQEQVVNLDSYTPEPSQYQKIPIYYDDDDDEESSIPLRDIIISGLPPCIAITPVLTDLIVPASEYEIWEIRIKQYFQIQDYALWEVIENGNSWVPIPVTATETGPSTGLKITVPSTTEEKICKKNGVKARSLLLMALPNEHQLTFD